MGWIFAIGILIGLLALFVFFKERKYKAIYAPGHFAELAQFLQKAKDSACANIGRPPILSPTDDDRVILSTAQIVSMYTVDKIDGGYSHCFSISIAGDYTPHAVGGMFTVYFSKLLSIPPEKLQLRISEANVYHCRYHLTADEHADIYQMQIPVPTNKSAAKIHAQCMSLLEQLHWARI